MENATEPTSRFAQIQLNSRFTSGFAALIFDVLLLMVIKVLAQSLCATANLYLVYDKRRSIAPSTSRLGYVTGGPVGPRSLSRVLSILILISTACVIILGFSINGKTIETYDTAPYRSVVQVTGKAADINFDEEFVVQSPQRQDGVPTHSISRRLAALADSYLCLEHNSSHGFVYAYAYEDDNLEGDMVGTRAKIPDAKCIRPPDFKEPFITRQYRLGVPGPPRFCTAQTVTPDIPDGSNRGTASFVMDSCDFEVSEMFCYRTDPTARTACAGMGQGKESWEAFAFLVPDATQARDSRITGVPPPLSEADGRKIAQNVAFFSAVGIGGEQVSNLANIAISEISHDVMLEHKTGDMQVSEIDLVIFIPVVAVVLSTTVLLAVIAIALWIQVVYAKGRRSYNKFCSFPETLQLADESCKAKLRQPWRDLPCIGIGKDEPRIIVTNRDRQEDCVGARWPEAEIDAMPWDDEEDTDPAYLESTLDTA